MFFPTVLITTCNIALWGEIWKSPWEEEENRNFPKISPAKIPIWNLHLQFYQGEASNDYYLKVTHRSQFQATEAQAEGASQLDSLGRRLCAGSLMASPKYFRSNPSRVIIWHPKGHFLSFLLPMGVNRAGSGLVFSHFPLSWGYPLGGRFGWLLFHIGRLREFCTHM